LPGCRGPLAAGDKLNKSSLSLFHVMEGGRSFLEVSHLQTKADSEHRAHPISMYVHVAQAFLQ